MSEQEYDVANATGVSDSGGESFGGDDSAASQGSPLLSGCGFCGAPYECLTPGPTCVFARKYAPAEPVTPREIGIRDVEEAAAFFEPSSGVWVTFKSGPKWDAMVGDPLTNLRAHPDELSALRHAVASGHHATFLEWGGEI